MIDGEVLETRTARDIARKAGLRGAAGVPVASRVRTLVDAWITPDTRPLVYQWLVDLSGFTKIRLTSQSVGEVIVYYSMTLSGDLDPGDFTEWSDLFTEQQFEVPGEGLFWAEIPGELRGPLRLTLANDLGNFELTEARVGPAFSMSLQAF